jgi:hypothetical protein
LMIIIREMARNYVKRMVNEYQSAAEIIAEVPARYISDTTISRQKPNPAAGNLMS